MMTRPLARYLPLALLSALAACVPAPAPTPPPPRVTPAPAPPPAPVPVVVAPPAPVYADWTHAPLTPGDWLWRRDGAASLADYRSPQGQVVAQLACNNASRRVTLSLAGWPAGNWTIRTESTVQQVAASQAGGSSQAVFAASDPLLDAIAFSRGRFAVEVNGRAHYLPSYPELTRVVADCR